jgi:uncharacterized protein YggU (UPF0235/DUF167 family)
MKIEVQVKPRSSQEKIVVSEQGSWVVYLREAPEKGKANEAMKRLLAEKLDVRKSAIRILKGKTSKTKLIEVK